VGECGERAECTGIRAVAEAPAVNGIRRAPQRLSCAPRRHARLAGPFGSEAFWNASRRWRCGQSRRGRG